MAQEEIAWTTFTHEHKEHSVDWYWTLGTVTVVAAAAAVFFGNMLLAVILVVGAGSIGVLVARGPREHMVRLGKRGLSVDGTLYPWNAIHSFWVEHDTKHPRLFVSTTGFLTPHFTFELEDPARAQEVRNFIARFAHEEEQGPHIGEHLSELLGL
jgi:hypothetical protein